VGLIVTPSNVTFVMLTVSVVAPLPIVSVGGRPVAVVNPVGSIEM
jgi:hypothetical protein